MKRSVILLIAAVVLAIAVGLIARRLGWLDPVRIAAIAVRLRRGHDPAITAPLFVLAFAIATALGVPGSPFMLVAGVLFGVVAGASLSLGGVLLGGIFGYGIALGVGRGGVDRFLGRHRRLERAMRTNAFWTLLRVRLIPVVPLSVGHFVAGLVRMPFGAFVLATTLGVAPFAILYAYLATSLLWGAEATRRSIVWNLVIASAALVAVSFLPMLARRARHLRYRSGHASPRRAGGAAGSTGSTR